MWRQFDVQLHREILAFYVLRLQQSCREAEISRIAGGWCASAGRLTMPTKFPVRRRRAIMSTPSEPPQFLSCLGAVGVQDGKDHG